MKPLRSGDPGWPRTVDELLSDPEAAGRARSILYDIIAYAEHWSVGYPSKREASDRLKSAVQAYSDWCEENGATPTWLMLEAFERLRR